MIGWVPQRAFLERHQVWFYLGSAMIGVLLGSVLPESSRVAGPAVWPLLALLMFATFTQLPLAAIPAVVTRGRFLLAGLIGNFVVMPLLVWGMVLLVPNDPVLRIGLLLVLLVPCTDWFVTFSHLGRGDGTRAAAFAPISLILQIVLLPLYLSLMSDIDLGGVFAWADVWPALLVVLGPLAVAGILAAWARGDDRRQAGVQRIGWWPVPLLSIVIALVATTHAGDARHSLHLLPAVVGISVAYLAAALAVAMVLSRALRLPTSQGRTLAFSLGTRNSFIVLPIALALPVGWEAAAVVIVVQSLVELFGMAVYVWFVPRVAFPVRAATAGR